LATGAGAGLTAFASAAFDPPAFGVGVFATTVTFAPLPGALTSGRAPVRFAAGLTATVCDVDFTLGGDLGAGALREVLPARAGGFALPDAFLAGFLVGLATGKTPTPFVVAGDTFVPARVWVLST
jgi:hypothetical protein